VGWWNKNRKIVLQVAIEIDTIGRSPMAMSREGGKFLGRLVEYDDSASNPSCSSTKTIIKLFCCWCHCMHRISNQS